MAAMCRAAITAGIGEIGFSEHFDSHPDDEGTGFFKAEAWWNDFEACKMQFRKTLTLKAGLEISEPHIYPEAVNALLEAHPWDYSIGSLHWIGDEIIFKDPYFARGEQDAYENYFLELQRMVELGRFDILGHLDIVKRKGFEHFGEFDVTVYEEMVRPILKTLVARDLALEVNTVTLRRSIGEPSPSSQILAWYKHEGGRWITLGSDAHKVDDVGACLEEAIGTIRTAGFNEVVSFTAGRPTPIELSESLSQI
jgi:histidinol-phosphatase (PHP family)